MNANRRKRLAALESQLDTIWSELDALVTEEDTAREAMPEAFCDAHQGSDCGDSRVAENVQERRVGAVRVRPAVQA